VARVQQWLSAELPYETGAGLALAQVRALLAALPPEESYDRLVVRPQTLAAQLQPLIDLVIQAGEQPPSLADLPQELKERYVGRSGRHLLRIYARGNIWDMDRLEQFVRALESVDPQVTGHPIQTFYASRHMQASYLWAGGYALLAVLALLWIDFRSLRDSLLAMLPLAIGLGLWCGCLGWLEIPLNPANMIVLPLLLGIGVDDGVHLVHRWRQQRHALGGAAHFDYDHGQLRQPHSGPSSGPAQPGTSPHPGHTDLPGQLGAIVSRSGKLALGSRRPACRPPGAASSDRQLAHCPSTSAGPAGTFCAALQ